MLSSFKKLVLYLTLQSLNDFGIPPIDIFSDATTVNILKDPKILHFQIIFKNMYCSFFQEIF